MPVGRRQGQYGRQNLPEDQRRDGIAASHEDSQPDTEREEPPHRLPIAAAFGFCEHPRERRQDAEVHHAGVVENLAAGEPQAPRARAEVMERQRHHDQAGHDRQRVLHVVEGSDRPQPLDAVHHVRVHLAALAAHLPAQGFHPLCPKKRRQRHRGISSGLVANACSCNASGVCTAPGRRAAAYTPSRTAFDARARQPCDAGNTSGAPV